MQQQGITQEQLAQYCMLSAKALNLWLDNKMTVSFSHIVRIADLLDIEAEDILDVV